MTLSTQAELASSIERHASNGTLNINGFIFRQFYSVESSLRKTLLSALYADEFTANYSFESKESSVDKIINFFGETSPENQQSHFMVFDKNSHFLGRCNLRVVNGKINFGIALHPAMQNKGYGKAILSALFTLCFNLLKLEQPIYGTTMSYNIKSQMAMQKAGMTPDGSKTKELNLSLDNKWLCYTITPQSFSANTLSKSPHPDSRQLRDVILEDYITSRKEKDAVEAEKSQYARINFFVKHVRRDFAFTQLKRKFLEEKDTPESVTPRY